MRQENTDTLVIRTPEGIAFSLLLASPVTRALAWSVDVACVGLATTLISYALRAVALVSNDMAMAATVWAYAAISVGYPIANEWAWRGQTLGKRLLRLRVVDAQGLRLQFSQIAIRNLLRLVDCLPMVFYLVGGIACLVTRRCQRLGDVAANTIVVRTPKVAEPDLAQAAPGKYNSFRDCPHVAARLRQNTSPQEASIALQALLRRDQLDPMARIELFNQIATHFRTLAAFPEELHAGLSDERYVRNVVDILFREAKSGSGDS